MAYEILVCVGEWVEPNKRIIDVQLIHCLLIGDKTGCEYFEYYYILKIIDDNDRLEQTQPQPNNDQKRKEIEMNATPHVSAFDERLPTELEVTNAETLRQIVASQIKEDSDTVIHIADDEGKSQPVTLSPALARSFLEVLRLVAMGRGFQLIPLDSQLTTQQAADLLNVSRPYLIKLLERDDIELKCTKVGRHRRIKASDLLAYKDKRDADRAKHLSDLAEFDGEHDLL